MATKFTFRCAKEQGQEEIIVNIDGEDICHDKLSEAFVRFLQACGYVFPPGDFIGLEFRSDDDADMG